MSILQWNCRGYYSNYGDLQKLIQDTSALCVCLQETLLGNKTPRAPQGYAIECHSPTVNPTPGNGLAILVHTSIPYQRLPLRTTLQAIACRIGMAQTYTVCSVYNVSLGGRTSAYR